MKKIIIGFFLNLLLIGVLARNVGAVSTPIPTPTPSEISSFELFWPIVAGKTMGDPSYVLKTLKEKIRGLVIFGKTQKADYFILLATKRVVEAEKLANNNEKDLALKTLNKANSLLILADKAIQRTPGDLIYSVTKDEMNKRLDNLEKFIPWLSSQKPELSARLQEVLEKVKTINSKV